MALKWQLEPNSSVTFISSVD